MRSHSLWLWSTLIFLLTFRPEPTAAQLRCFACGITGFRACGVGGKPDIQDCSNTVVDNGEGNGLRGCHTRFINGRVVKNECSSSSKSDGCDEATKEPDGKLGQSCYCNFSFCNKGGRKSQADLLPYLFSGFAVLVGQRLHF